MSKKKPKSRWSKPNLRYTAEQRRELGKYVEAHGWWHGARVYVR